MNGVEKHVCTCRRCSFEQTQELKSIDIQKTYLGETLNLLFFYFISSFIYLLTYSELCRHLQEVNVLIYYSFYELRILKGNGSYFHSFIHSFLLYTGTLHCSEPNHVFRVLFRDFSPPPVASQDLG